MPNEVTSLLNALNTYITCPVCKVTNEIEIILTCGHLICKNCKTKRTKCPVCYSELLATRPHSPSVKFIKELCKELVKTSTGGVNGVESEFYVGNSIITPNVKGEQTTRSDSETLDYEKIKIKTNFGLKDDVENNNYDVKIIDEINTLRSKDNNRKNSSHKKGIVFYRNYCNHKKEREVYRKILKGLGIVGIDKQIKKFKSKHALNARGKGLNGQLNTIISRLNDYDNLQGTKFKYSTKMISDSDSSDSEQKIKMNHKTSMNLGETKDGLGIIKCDLKRNGFNLINTSGGLKRKKVDSGTEESPCSKVFVNNIDEVDDCIELGTVNLNKKLGGIVDEAEIVQRYLNSSMNGAGTEEIKDRINLSSNIDIINKSCLPSKSEFPKEGPSITSKTYTDDNKCERLSKPEIKNIISEFMEETSPNSEEEGLQSDIMADMLHNVSNEIVVVGNTLCAAGKNGVCNSSINSSYDVGNLKNRPVNNSTPCKLNDNKRHSLTIKNETDGNSCDNDIIVVSDSEDDVELVGKNAISDTSQTKCNQVDTHLEKDRNIMNCRIVLKDLDLGPLMFQSVNNSIHMCNDECLENSKVKKSLSLDNTANTGRIDHKNKSPEKGKMDVVNQKSISENSNGNLMQTLPKVPLGQKRNKCDEDSNDFEGFTEDDILILTVKLALFKMNGSKYSKNLPSSSLYALDGKQILIKDVSQEEDYPNSPCCQNKM